MHASRRLFGICLALGATLVFTLLNIITRYVVPDASIWQIMFGRALFGVLVLLVLGRVFRIGFTAGNTKAMAVLGVIIIGMSTSITAAVILAPLFEVLILFYLFPFFAAIISPYMTGDRVRRSDWFLIVAAFAGSLLILWSGGEGAFKWRLGHLLALVAAFGQGLALTLVRRYSGDHHPLTPLFYSSLVGSVVLFLPSVWPGFAPIPTAAALGGILAIAVLAVLGLFFSFKALSYLPSPEVGAISMMEVVWGGLAGFLFFHEAVTLRGIIGAVLIILSGLAFAQKGRKAVAKISPTND